MSYQKPPIIDEDETAVPLGTTILPSMTTTTGHRSKRMLAILAAGMLMLVAGGAFLMQDASVSYDHAVGSLNTAAEDSGTTTTVTVVNDTPYDVRPLSRQNPSLQYTHVGYLLDFRYQNSLGMRNVCWSDHFDDPGIKAGQRWMASSSRGTCLVNKVVAVLSLPDGRGVLQCTNYEYEHDDYEKWHFGPYKVVRHNENGTITYEKEPFNNQTVNSRRAKPYHWRNAPPGNAPPGNAPQ